MTDLAEFLLARIAEDEEAIKGRSFDRPIHFIGCYYYDYTLDANRFCDCDEDGDASRRYLAECDAKRRIVEVHAAGATGWNEVDGEPLRYCTHCHRETPCATVRLLALPYADHPDYREEWGE